MGQASETLKKKFHAHEKIVERVFAWAGYLATAASLIWTAVLFLAARNEIKLVVWVEKESFVYPSEQTWDEALPLQFQETEAKSIRLLAVQISNYGKTTIGEQKALWQLGIEAPSAARVVMVGALKTVPSGIVARAVPDKTPNVFRLELGALEPSASIKLTLMLLNPAERQHPRLKVRPSLEGLPHELIPRSPVEELTERFGWPLFLTLVLAFGVFSAPEVYSEARKKHKSGWPLGRSIIFRTLGALLLLLICAVFLARGLAHVVTWFW